MMLTKAGDEELPLLPPETQAKYKSYWRSLSQRTSEQAPDPNPQETALTAVATAADMNVQAILQRAQECPELRAMLLQQLGGPTPVPPSAASNAPTAAIQAPVNHEARVVKPEPPVKREPCVKRELAEPRLEHNVPPPPLQEAVPPPACNSQSPDQPSTRCTSTTHPNAWRSFGRFVLRNQQCTELAKAWSRLRLHCINFTPMCVDSSCC